MEYYELLWINAVWEEQYPPKRQCRNENLYVLIARLESHPERYKQLDIPAEIARLDAKLDRPE